MRGGRGSRRAAGVAARREPRPPRTGFRVDSCEFVDHSAASDTQTISLSLRAYIRLLANAGCDQITFRPGGPARSLVGSRIFARLTSSYFSGDNLAMISSPI